MSSQIRPNNFNVLPVVVKNLLIINGLLFLATIVFQGRFAIDLTEILGLHFPFSDDFRPYQVISYMFMHATNNGFGGIYIWHIFFNMFALWMFGNSLENLWGPKRFLIYYIVTGIGAAICHYLVVYIQIAPTLKFVDYYINNPSLDLLVTNNALGNLSPEFMRYLQGHHIAVNGLTEPELLSTSVDFMKAVKQSVFNSVPPIIGASGSVFGILLAFGMLFPNTLLYLYFAIPIKAKWFVILYGGLELYSGLSNNPGDNVAHFAHLGGMLFGFILIKYWQKNSNHFY